MRLPPGLCPGPRWGAYSALRPPAGKGWVEGQSRIFIRCPAVPQNQQMSRIFRKWYYYFFRCRLDPILHVCLATQQSDELRIKIGKDRFRIRTPTGPLIINTLKAYYRSVRQMPSILHARQPSPTTVYFFNAATPASSVNTATVVFTATLEYNTTNSRPYSAAAK